MTKTGMAKECGDGRGQEHTAGLVAAAAMLLLVAESWLRGQFGWPAKNSFLLDFAALAAVFWTISELLMIWLRCRLRKVIADA